MRFEFPELRSWPWFLVSVFVASIIINTVTRRVTGLAVVQQGF